MHLDVYELFVVGYINEAGELNMGRFQTFMRAVAEVNAYYIQYHHGHLYNPLYSCSLTMTTTVN